MSALRHHGFDGFRPIADLFHVPHSDRMRGQLMLVVFLVAALGGCAALGVSNEGRFLALFGTTEFQPMRLPRTPAGDYVPDAENAVPSAIRRCGGRSLSYIPMTDGGARVEFTSSTSLARIEACLAKFLPQVTIRASLPPR